MSKKSKPRKTPDSQPPPQQQGATISATPVAKGWFERLSAGVDLAASVATLLAAGFAVFLFFFSRDLPPTLEISAAPFAQLDREDPFSMYFLVQNRSAFRIREVTGVCHIIKATFQGEGEYPLFFEEVVTAENRDPVELAPGQSMAMPCESTVPREKKVQTATFEVIVRYRYWWGRLGDTRFRFEGRCDSDGRIVWLPQGGSLGKGESLPAEKAQAPALTAIALTKTARPESSRSAFTFTPSVAESTVPTPPPRTRSGRRGG